MILQKFKMNQLQSSIPSFFVCQKSLIYLRNNQSLAPDVEACICGSIFCLLSPKIFDFGKNNNQSELFFAYREDSKLQQTIIINQEKSSLMLVGRGQRRGSYFSGQCNVCSFKYADYLKHIQSVYHKSKVRNSHYSHLIAELIKQMSTKMNQNPKRPKRRGRFVNKNGTNKKIRFFSKNLLSGKFQKRNQQ